MTLHTYTPTKYQHLTSHAFGQAFHHLPPAHMPAHLPTHQDATGESNTLKAVG